MFSRKNDLLYVQAFVNKRLYVCLAFGRTVCCPREVKSWVVGPSLTMTPEDGGGAVGVRWTAVR
jgi:hypothetical protein